MSNTKNEIIKTANQLVELIEAYDDGEENAYAFIDEVKDAVTYGEYLDAGEESEEETREHAEHTDEYEIDELAVRLGWHVGLLENQGIIKVDDWEDVYSAIGSVIRAYDKALEDYSSFNRGKNESFNADEMLDKLLREKFSGRQA